MAYEDRESYRQSLEDRLRQYDADWDKWYSSRRNVNNPDVEALRTRRTALDKKMGSMGNVAEDKWGDFKRDVDNAWEGLKSDFRRLTSR